MSEPTVLFALTKEELAVVTHAVATLHELKRKQHGKNWTDDDGKRSLLLERLIEAKEDF